MIPRWLIYSTLAALAWALWAVLSKVVDSSHLSLSQTQLLFTMGLLPPAAMAWRKSRPTSVQFRSLGFLVAGFAGLMGAAGNLAFFAALAEGGRAAIIIPFTSLYPLITLAIALLFLRERINGVQSIGVIVSVLAAVLLSGEATNLLQARGAFTPGAWMGYAVLALIGWGLLSAAQKISSNTVSPELSFVAFTIAFIPVTLVVVARQGINWHFPGSSFGLGTLAGGLNGIGVLASFAAYRANGKASIVTPLAGLLTSAFTVALAIVFLKEHLDRAESIGVAVAIVAAVALSFERPSKAP